MRIAQDEDNNKKSKKENVERNDTNILAILFASLGLLTLWVGEGTYKGFAVPGFVGWIELGVAAAFAILGFRAEQNPYEAQITICHKCQTVYSPQETPNDSKCQNCQCPLEPLEGFYERHPELKDSPEEFTQSEND
ncbi:hypothetical protein [Maridesulfovibrio sp. FT414]|uniref:hypothetical protein n=1 Tax=Maridesulfovibrio sp. FT414 TaxID=2979469 RepID=UPI003D806EFD